MPIYTGRGDQGRTDLWASDRRVSKSSHRIEAYGAIDEVIGLLAHAAAHTDAEVAQEIETVQNQLHVLMAQLADAEEKGEQRIGQHHVEHLEDRIDHFNEELPALDGFILPGGSEAGSILHYARSVCRRAERRVVTLDEQDGVAPDALTYINRLSDLLFTLGRYQNMVDGEDEKNVTYQ
ncbi:MAG: cob(I)yrinic acid a,c-diamide adenosyltransferase [Candidatus Nanohaloarchaea archaeon]|nr:cob(I)yrinic acid a,c-diamide adenosyltransferase [Candidatus Nanohaloarchaea archaeon]